MSPENEALIIRAKNWFKDPDKDENAMFSDIMAYKLIAALIAAEKREQKYKPYGGGNEQ